MKSSHSPHLGGTSAHIVCGVSKQGPACGTSANVVYTPDLAYGPLVEFPHGIRPMASANGVWSSTHRTWPMRGLHKWCANIPSILKNTYTDIEAISYSFVMSDLHFESADQLLDFIWYEVLSEQEGAELFIGFPAQPVLGVN